MLNLLKIKALRVAVLLLLGVFPHALPAAARSDIAHYDRATRAITSGGGETHLYTPADGAFFGSGRWS